MAKPIYDLQADPADFEPWYTRHVGAMTAERLHLKSDIALELARRDAALALLCNALDLPGPRGVCDLVPDAIRNARALLSDSDTPATPSPETEVPTVCDETGVTRTDGKEDTENTDMLRRYGASLPGDDHCHAAQDGECFWPECPQERDGEPSKTGRHCPLDR